MTNPPPRIRAVVFDFDGTLFWTTDAIVCSFCAALQTTGRPDVAPARVERLIGRPLREMFQTIVTDASPAEIESLVAAYRSVFKHVALERSRPAPGFHIAMTALYAAGIRMAIATHRLADGAHLILDHFGATHWFDAIVTLDDIRRPKPAPDPLWQALAAIGTPPAEAAAVGDTPDDVRAGVAAGMWSIAIETQLYPLATLQAAGAHAVLSSLAELPTYLQQLTAEAAHLPHAE